MRVMISRGIVWLRRIYFNPPSISRNPAIEIDNNEIIEIEAGDSIDAEESIEVEESTDTGSDDKNFIANVEDGEPVHKEKVEERKDDDNQEEWQKATITKSRRVSPGHGVRFVDEQWAAEQGNIGISKAEANYYAILQQLSDEEEENMK
eukprot:8791825-Ditylum_brightwellii.AAC.1